MKDAPDVGECKIDGETPKLVIWKDEDQKNNWVDTSKQISCAMGKDFGVSTLTYVAGEKWSVTDTSQKLADKIAGAIGGQAVQLACGEE